MATQGRWRLTCPPPGCPPTRSSGRCSTLSEKRRTKSPLYNGIKRSNDNNSPRCSKPSRAQSKTNPPQSLPRQYQVLTLSPHPRPSPPKFLSQMRTTEHDKAPNHSYQAYTLFSTARQHNTQQTTQG